ncbi:nucleotidyltransferase domain-containing protein [Methylopila sp. M107]|uniref:nucleotidyltransferase domain-containing protein n=1 Tax=Methylopila sp. M107 TaxID=1101190 RepID=UPI0003800FB4|nr:nucleotidyltransferase domain-containing protein [Methylopila sp. M107]
MTEREGLTPKAAAAAWRPPTEQEVERDLAAFAALVRETLGGHVEGVYLFGSRARGDNHPDSDADVAVVVDDETARRHGLETELVELAFDILLSGKTVIEPFLVPLSGWFDPDLQHNQYLGRAMKRDGRAVS